MSNIKNGHSVKSPEDITLDILRCISESDRRIIDTRTLRYALGSWKIQNKFVSILEKMGFIHKLTEEEIIEHAKYKMIQQGGKLPHMEQYYYKINPRPASIRKYMNNTRNRMRDLYTITEAGMKLLRVLDLMQSMVAWRQ